MVRWVFTRQSSLKLMKNQISDHLNTIRFISISVVAGLMGVVFMPILTHSMTTGEFASFSKSLLYAQMIATPSVFGISAYLTTMVEKIDSGTDDISSAFTDWFLLLAILTVLMLLGTVILGFALSVILLILVSYARAFQTVGAQSCRLLRSPAGFALYQIAIPASFFIIAIICARTLRLSGVDTFYLASVVYLLASFYLWRQFNHRGWINQVWTGGFRNPRFVRFALGAFTHSLAGLAVTSWDKVYAASLLSPESFGIYIVGAQYAGGLVLIFTSISQAVVPQMYLLLAMKEGSAVACGKFFMIITAGFVLIFALFEMAIGPVLRIIFPDHFHSAITIAQLLGVAALLQGLYFISSAVLFYYHRTFSLAMITISCGVFGAVFALMSGASQMTDVVSIAISVWGAFFVLTTMYSAVLVIKND